MLPFVPLSNLCYTIIAQVEEERTALLSFGLAASR